ncbi:helix-hairpin-helix domain-containing protein [Salimicrobium sp. PL1-032A]|uniref:helix-hairpin-helix domain-containing protein n=1 Tax=Salimicrobium sp. PL1-032A TaxID=3095364 RepID=UPI0032610D8B
MFYIRKYWFVGLFGIIIAVFAYQMSGEEKGTVMMKEEPRLVEDEEGEDASPAAPEPIIVDIKGSVKRPGVYEGTSTMRVHEIVDLAGGFTEDADETSVNLAQKIEDEMVVLVASTGNSEEGTSVIEQSDKVRINQAALEEITSINGIGPSKAEAIIAYREENGNFKKIEDLLEVSGIGEKTLENMKEDIQIP